MKKFVLAAVLFLVGILFFASTSLAALCGDARTEGSEECDNGQNNCDNCPNACRTNCVLPRCGDYAVDSGEQCDDFTNNSDKIPGACRTSCKKAYCGDGVLDLAQGEACDDANQDAFDGCHQCQKCIELKDNLMLSNAAGKTIVVCPKDYEFKDQGQEGVVVLSSPGMTFDCQGATIRGAATLASSVAQSTKVPSPVKDLGSQKSTSARASRQKEGSGKQSLEVTPRPVDPPAGPAAIIAQGTGIVVAADNIVVRNCRVTNFRTGIKIQSSGSVLLDNSVCKNQKDIVAIQAGNYGVKNYCAVPSSWSENGKPGCTFSCP